MKISRLIFFLLATTTFISCEDVIDVNVAGEKPVLVVEGWLTNKSDTQYVKLYNTRGVSDERDYLPVEGALVELSDDEGHRETLAETGPGTYAISSVRGVSGRTYTLNINTSTGSYEAVSVMPRTSFFPDTLGFRMEQRSATFGYDGYYPLLSGQELEGEGDYIQIRLYKNGVFLSGTNDINLYTDKYSDGYYISDLMLHVEKPFEKGDLVKAEVWSLNEPAYFFWNDIQTQLQNARIFASPLTNPRSNIRKLGSTGVGVTGFFGTSMVRSVQGRAQ